MGWDKSPVDGNGMGWKLLCVVMRWDVMGWESSGAGMGWYMTRDNNRLDGDGIEGG